MNLLLIVLISFSGFAKGHWHFDFTGIGGGYPPFRQAYFLRYAVGYGPLLIGTTFANAQRLPGEDERLGVISYFPVTFHLVQKGSLLPHLPPQYYYLYFTKGAGVRGGDWHCPFLDGGIGVSFKYGISLRLGYQKTNLYPMSNIEGEEDTTSISSFYTSLMFGIPSMWGEWRVSKPSFPNRFMLLQETLGGCGGLLISGLLGYFIETYLFWGELRLLDIGCSPDPDLFPLVWLSPFGNASVGVAGGIWSVGKLYRTKGSFMNSWIGATIGGLASGALISLSKASPFAIATFPVFTVAGGVIGYNMK